MTPGLAGGVVECAVVDPSRLNTLPEAKESPREPAGKLKDQDKGEEVSEATGSLDPASLDRLLTVLEGKVPPLESEEEAAPAPVEAARSARLEFEETRRRVDRVLRRMERPLSMTVKVKSRGRATQTDSEKMAEAEVQATSMFADCETQTDVCLPGRVRCLWSSHISEPTAVVDEANVARSVREHQHESEEAELLMDNEDMSANDPRRNSGRGVVSRNEGVLDVDSLDVKEDIKEREAMAGQEELSPIKSDSGLFDFDDLEDKDPSFTSVRNELTGHIDQVDSDGDMLPGCDWSSDGQDEGPRSNYYHELPEDPGARYWSQKLPDSDHEIDIEHWKAERRDHNDDSDADDEHPTQVGHECQGVDVQKEVERIEKESEAGKALRERRKKKKAAIRRPAWLTMSMRARLAKKPGDDTKDNIPCPRGQTTTSKLEEPRTTFLNEIANFPMNESGSDKVSPVMSETSDDLVQSDAGPIHLHRDRQSRPSGKQVIWKEERDAKSKKKKDSKAKKKMSPEASRMIDRLLATLHVPKEVRKGIRLKMTRGITVDSGAADNVIPRRVLRRWMKVRQNAASRSGVHYVAADGARIANEGEVDFAFQDRDGKTHTWVFQVANVNKVLASVSSLVDCGYRVVFDKDLDTGEDLSFIIHKKTNDTINMKRERNIWTIDAFVNEDSDFSRQE